MGPFIPPLPVESCVAAFLWITTYLVSTISTTSMTYHFREGLCIRNCIGVVLTKQGSRKMIDDDCKVIMEVHEQTTDIPLSLTNSIRIPPHTIAGAIVECAKPLRSTMDIRAD